MNSAPWLCPALGYGKSVGKIVHILITAAYLDVFSQPAADKLLELLLYITADNEYHLVKSCPYSVCHGIFHQQFAVRSHRGKLLNAAFETGPQTCGKYQ